MFGLGLLLPAAQAQTQPDLKAVLKKVSEIYKAATQYEFIGDATCRAEPLHTTQPVHVLMALRLPDKYRMMAGNPCDRPGDGGVGEVLMVFDGSLLWTYLLQENLYDSVPESALTEVDPAGGVAGLGPDSVDHETMSAYRDAADSSADFIREETISVGGAKTGCYVVRVTPKDHSPVQTWWIDNATYHIVRGDDDESSVVFTTIKLNEPLADDLFKFTPPPGAKKVVPDR